MTKEKDDIIDEKIKEAVWKAHFPKIRAAVFFNLIASVILFAIMVKKCPVFSDWLQQEHPNLCYGVIIILGLLIINALLILIGGKKAKLGIVAWITLINAIVAVGVCDIFKENAKHMTTQEDIAFYILIIEAAIHIVTGIIIIKEYKGMR